MKAVLRTMFNSDFFKKARFSKIKSPAEVVLGTLKMVEAFQFPEPNLAGVAPETGYMGQALLDPPSVEGWYTGTEWINSGSLLARVNFVADKVTDTSLPGIKSIIAQMQADGVSTPEQLVEAALDHMGYVELAPETRQQLLDHARGEANLDWSGQSAGSRVGEMLALVGSTTEYQFG